MAIPYNSVSISGYNANPPPDDGSAQASNEISWANHKNKLGDPVKTALESMNTNLVTAFGLIHGSGVTSITSAHTLTTANRGKRLGVTNETTITLLPSATAGTGFPVTIANDDASAIVAIDGDSAETVGGVAILYLFPGESVTILADGTSSWLLLADNRSKIPVGTILHGIFTTADPGYTLCDGATIGNAASGAGLAKAYTANLFAKLLAMNPNAGTEVFADDDTVVKPDMRGKLAAGLDNLGGSSANVITATEADTLGDTYGTETQAAAGTNGNVGATTLTTSQIPALTYTMPGGSANDTMSSAVTRGNSAVNPVALGGLITSNAGGSSHLHAGSTFTGSATNIVQPSLFCGAQIKL